jgi:uncharacterized protein Yka (UPF0111/DUF47 family)
MFSLQKLVGGGDIFFDLLERSAREANEGVQILVKTLSSPGPATLDQLALVRRKDKRITEELQERLVTTFVTPLEREDIDALSTALYKIPKTLEKFVERFLICPERVQHASFSRQAELLQQSMETLLSMVADLRNSPDLGKVKEKNDKLQYLEGEADKHMTALLKDLYNTKHDSVSVVALKDLFDLLEKVIDRCRDAGNVIVQIVLKNS